MYDCNVCAKNPKMREVWGCESKCKTSTPAFYEIENGVYYRYWNCPRRLLPYSIVKSGRMYDDCNNIWYSFLDLYRFYDKYPAGMPAIDLVSQRYILAVNYYDGKIAEYTNEKYKAEEIKWQQKSSKLKRG